MKPEIYKISEISPEQSVVCIVGKDNLPETVTNKHQLFKRSFLIQKCSFLVRKRHTIERFLI